MVVMKKGPIGVWFSVALAIFLLSLWAGFYLGSIVAPYWYRHAQQVQITVGGPERAHLESVLSELDTVQTLQIFSAVNANDQELGKKVLLNDIGVLKNLERKSGLEEIKPAIDFNLGRAYVYAALLEEHANNNEQATRYIKSAQALFQSLGWSKYTEETLKTVARRELDQWKAQPQTKEHGQ
jgi:hypothetical protein